MNSPILVNVPRKRYVEKETKLFNYLMDKYHLRNDAELADFLFCSKTVVSMTRTDHRSLSPTHTAYLRPYRSVDRRHTQSSQGVCLMDTLILILTAAGIMGGAGVVLAVAAFAFWRFTR